MHLNELRRIPAQLLSQSIFANGWDGHILPIYSNTKNDNAQITVHPIETNDPCPPFLRGLYNNEQEYKIKIDKLWNSITQNLLIPKSLISIVDKIRLPLIAALIRHLPDNIILLFFNEELCKKDVFSKQLTVDEQTTIKQVFMIGNNILRWVIDNIREETKCFHDLLSLYDICVSIENEKIKLSKFITANISNENTEDKENNETAEKKRK